VIQLEENDAAVEEPAGVTDTNLSDMAAGCGFNDICNRGQCRCPKLDLPYGIEAVQYKYIAVEIQNPWDMAKELGEEKSGPYNGPKAINQRKAANEAVIYAMEIDLRAMLETHSFQQPAVVV
jgi:hypothetical protein